MTRTLHYKLYCSAETFNAVWPAIERVQSAMNERFAWSHERLNLELYDECYFFDDTSDPLAVELARHSPMAAGSSFLGDDDWNALLALRFLRWVSTLRRDLLVRVYDEGSFISVGGLVALYGEWHVDQWSLDASIRYLVGTGRWDDYSRLRKAREIARQDQLFATIPAEAYADRPEIQALEIPGEELKTLAIEQIASRLQFPWTDASEAATN